MEEFKRNWPYNRIGWPEPAQAEPLIRTDQLVARIRKLGAGILTRLAHGKPITPLAKDNVVSLAEYREQKRIENWGDVS